jgi:HD-GYP domain-containing protein (c-di-GMP phosphodiesterase class II)
MNSIKIKLLGLIAAIVLIMTTVTIWFNLDTQKTMLTRFAAQNARVLAETIHNSIISTMESGRNADIIRVFKQIEEEAAIDSVMIFDPAGRILISTDSAETGDLIPSSQLLAFRSNMLTLIEKVDDSDYLTALKPIPNMDSCHSCHSADNEFLGILKVRLSLKILEELKMSGSTTTIYSSGGMFLLIFLTLSSFIIFYIEKPIRKIIAAMDLVEKGRFDAAKTNLTGSTEMELLSFRFNNMIKRLQGLIETTIENERSMAISHEKLAHHEEIEHMNLALEERLKEIEFLNISMEERIEEIEEANFKIADLASELEGKNTTLEKTVERLSALYKMGLATNSIMGIDQLFDLLLQKTMETIEAEFGYILLLDREKWKLEVVGVRGLPNDDEIINETIPLEPGGISHWVVVNSEPLLVKNVQTSNEFNTGSLLGFNRESVICAPLVIKNGIIGTITMSNKRDGSAFDNDDLSLLNTIAAQASVGINNSRLYEEQQKTYLNTVHALVTAIEASDTYTRGHSERVTRYSMALGQRMGLDAESMNRLEQAAILHDIGKIGIALPLLHKEEKLNKDDIDLLRQHPAIGARILQPVGFLKQARMIVLQHHERYDGKGYPNGIPGEEILIESRIIAVADTYDAMTSDRPYRKALSHDVTLVEIQSCSGTQFDPEITAHFIELCKDDEWYSINIAHETSIR